MIDLFHDGGQLVLNGLLQFIGKAEVVLRLTQTDDLLGQGDAALAALGPHLGQGHIDPQGAALILHQLQLGLSVGGEAVDGHHAGQAIHLGDVLHMAQEIGQAPLQGGEVLLVQFRLGCAPVVLQGPDGGHQHHRVGGEAGHAAFDVQELLSAQVGAEAGLGDGVVPQLQSHPGGHHRVAAVGDIGKGAAVDEGRGALQSLDQVGLQGVLQQGGHGPGGLQIAGGDRLFVIGVAHDDAAQSLLQVGDGGGQAQHRHDLTGHSDVKAVLPGDALHPAAQAVNHVAELAVVHVHAPLPGDALDVDAQGVTLLDVIVQHGGQQVIGRTDGMEVASEVEVDILHRNDLGVAAASGAPLHAEYRAEGGLPQGHQGVLAQAAHPVGQTHGGGGLALSGGGGVDGGDQDQLAIGGLALLEQAVVDLGLVLSVKLQVLLVHTGGPCDVRDVLHLGALGDFNVSFHLCHVSFSVLGAPLIKKERNGFDSVRPDGRHKGGGSARYTPCGRSTSVSRIAFDRS